MVVDVRGPGGQRLPAIDTRVACSNVRYTPFQRHRSRWHFAESGIDRLHARARIDCQPVEAGISCLRVLRTDAETIPGMATQSGLIDVRPAHIPRYFLTRKYLG